MDAAWQESLWRQFGAAIDMLEGAVRACPDALWGAADPPAFWHVAYHTLFYLDEYLSDSPQDFAPPAPFAAGPRRLEAAAPRPYAKEDLLVYLADCRRKCRATIRAMTDERAGEPCGLDWLDISRAELLLYNLRHVQHHAGQLSLRLREATGAGSDWVSRAGEAL